MTASAHPAPSLPPRRSAEGAAPREAPDAGPVVVPESARFEGLLTFRGRAQIDGELEGEILCRGTLRLGETARVVAQIEADELIVAGSFEGDATARYRIQLTPTARVKGVIRAPKLSMEDGCVLDGRCETAAPEPVEES
jgi:cytoskeletal protein CcmA (bactofilin family)